MEEIGIYLLMVKKLLNLKQKILKLQQVQQSNFRKHFKRLFCR